MASEIMEKKYKALVDKFMADAMALGAGGVSVGVAEDEVGALTAAMGAPQMIMLGTAAAFIAVYGNGLNAEAQRLIAKRVAKCIDRVFQIRAAAGGSLKKEKTEDAEREEVCS